MRKDTKEREKRLCGEFGVSRVTYMAECAWTKAKKADIDTVSPEEREFCISVQDFMRNHFAHRPSERISLRDALKGGR
jgi:hypothetical protein